MQVAPALFEHETCLLKHLTPRVQVQHIFTNGGLLSPTEEPETTRQKPGIGHQNQHPTIDRYYTTHLAKRLRLVGKMLQRTKAGNEIEECVGKRQGFADTSHDTIPLQAPSRRVQCRDRDIRPDCICTMSSSGQNPFTTTTSHIKQTHTWHWQQLAGHAVQMTRNTIRRPIAQMVLVVVVFSQLAVFVVRIHVGSWTFVYATSALARGGVRGSKFRSFTGYRDNILRGPWEPTEWTPSLPQSRT